MVERLRYCFIFKVRSKLTSITIRAKPGRDKSAQERMWALTAMRSRAVRKRSLIALQRDLSAKSLFTFKLISQLSERLSCELQIRYFVPIYILYTYNDFTINITTRNKNLILIYIYNFCTNIRIFLHFLFIIQLNNNLNQRYKYFNCLIFFL